MVDSLFVFDGKEFIVQICDDVIPADPSQKVYHVLVREWKPDAWEFGPLHEVTIERMASCDKLATFLQANYFPHIALNNLFGLKVNLLKEWTRSDLAIKSWQSLASQKHWIGQSNLEINRDSVFIVVKDSHVPQRQLKLGEDDEMIRKYASPNYLGHISSKHGNIAASGTKFDSLYDASQSYSATMATRTPANYGKEQGITITVGKRSPPPKKEEDENKDNKPDNGEEEAIPDDFMPLF
jgi:hypothetical protein